MFDWYSPVYMIPLPVDAQFDITFHTAGQPDLRQAEAAVQTRVLAGGALTGARMTEDGMLQLVQARQGGGLQFSAACDARGLGAVSDTAWPFSEATAPGVPQIEAVITTSGAVTQGIPFYLHSVQPVTIAQKSDGIVAFLSQDDGATWSENMVLVSGVQLVAADIGPDGGTIHIVGTRAGAALSTCSR